MSEPLAPSVVDAAIERGIAAAERIRANGEPPPPPLTGLVRHEELAIMLRVIAKHLRDELATFAAEQSAEIKRQIAPLAAIIAASDRANKTSPPMRYLGVFDARTIYAHGDVVTRAGCLWSANKATVNEVPGVGPGPWVMITKSPK